MKVAIDTSILLDVLGADPDFGERSREALKKAWTSGAVVVCDVVLAEVSAFFPPGDDPTALLAEMGIVFKPLSGDAAVDAGRRWKAFRTRGGPRRDRVIADFLVGAHALLAADALLTRDRGFHRSAFSDLRILESALGNRKPGSGLRSTLCESCPKGRRPQGNTKNGTDPEARPRPEAEAPPRKGRPGGRPLESRGGYEKD